MPGFRKMNPAPKIVLTRFGAGVHSFWKAEKDLPAGIVPSVLRTWNDAVLGRIFRIASYNLRSLISQRLAARNSLSSQRPSFPHASSGNPGDARWTPLVSNLITVILKAEKSQSKRRFVERAPLSSPV
jgi:hypothetical protein